MDLLLAQPRGFCAGVSRAIEIVERALEIHGAPVYVYHEIVHNAAVVASLAARGALFVDDIATIPLGALTVFSAHGVSLAVRAQAQARALRVIDATCPMVAKVHLQAERYARRGFEVVLVGHHGHEEVEGTRGSIDGPVHVVATLADVDRLPFDAGARVAYVTQTTLSIDDTREIIQALKERWPHVQGPELDDICYATFNRQTAVRQLAAQVDVVLVVGSPNSSNSNRLREVARSCGRPAYLVQDATELDPAWIRGMRRVGITAGASAPEVLVQQLCTVLRSMGAESVSEMPGTSEQVTFRLPDLIAPRADAPMEPHPMAVERLQPALHEAR
jgi:4-hydroxy-3-methylbut-2-enyl diphosphate reductase